MSFIQPLDCHDKSEVEMLRKKVARLAKHNAILAKRVEEADVLRKGVRNFAREIEVENLFHWVGQSSYPWMGEESFNVVDMKSYRRMMRMV